MPALLRYLAPILLAPLIACASTAAPAAPEPETVFTTGPVFPEFGQAILVETTDPLPTDAHFKIAFDMSAAAEEGEVARTLNSVARFINMHVRAGVPLENIDIAVVVHGKATLDMAAPSNEGAVRSSHFTNDDAITTLIDKSVRIIVCGQSAAHYEVGIETLHPGVEMALSAMTAHAQLQQDGYTLNPF